MVLYTRYAYPFEIAAVLLLTAIIAAIALTFGKGKKHRRQSPSKQIAVRREDCVRLVDMPSEKTNPPGIDPA
jgi:NADH-quinone oxidoreductase subunit J